MTDADVPAVEVSSGAMVKNGINTPAALQSNTTITGLPIHCFNSDTGNGTYSVLFLSKTQISPRLLGRGTPCPL